MTEPLTMHERVVAAAAALTCEVGWAGVTMGKLADRVGVSRQTVYNEIGSKPELAEAMVLRELGEFLAGVDRGFDAHPDDLVAAIRSAVTNVLVTARSNALLQAIVTQGHGGSAELLPLLTTQSDALVDIAKVVVAQRLAPYGVDLADDRLDAAVDVVVRVALSHVMHPTGEPEQTGADIAWIADRVLRP